MEDNRNTEYPISTFKVDFGCSKGCPADVRNMLQQLKGVKSISIDARKGKVTVVGNVNPTTLIKFFEKMGKKAKLCSFEQEPKKCHHSHGKQKHHSHSCCESSDSEDEFKADHSHSGDHRMHRTRHGQRSKKRYGFGNEYASPPSPPPMARYHHGPSMSRYDYYQQQPLPGYHHQYHPHPPSMPLNHHMTYGYARPRPMYGGGYYGMGQPVRPSYGYYDSRFPRYNPMVNSADNYNYRYRI